MKALDSCIDWFGGKRMIKHLVFTFLSVLVLAGPALADTLCFAGDNKLDGHVLRRTREDTNFKLIFGANLQVDNEDITRTETEPFVVYLLKRGEYYLSERQDTERALKNFNDALKLKPGDPYIQERIDWDRASPGTEG